MDVTIRAYQNTDREKLAELFYEFQSYFVHIDPLKRHILTPEFGKKCVETVLEETEKFQGKILLAKLQGTIIGCIVGVIKEQTEIDRLANIPTLTGEVLELYVEATSRSKGIGTKLLVQMEEYFKKNNCTVISIGVFAPNEPARNFYKKHGFQDRVVTVIKPLV